MRQRIVQAAISTEICCVADVVLVPSEAMAAAVGDGAEARGDCVVIEDPWQVREQPFTPWRPGEPLRLAWFGNPSNVGYLCDQLGPLMQQACGADAYELTVLARRESVAAIDRAFAAASAIRPWRLLPVEWNSRDQPQQLERVLGGSHVCLLPSDHADYKKIGVSHNRLVDSVRSGCVVIASPMASYLELAKLALISTDFPSTLNRLGSNYERLCGKYEGLRRRELARFSPALNQQKWTDLLSAMA